MGLIDLISVVGPRAELERAQLFVERIELDVNGTRTLVDGRRFPVDLAIGKQRRLGHQRHLVTAVGAVNNTGVSSADKIRV